jgi:SAM-dependent methyltransferase
MNSFGTTKTGAETYSSAIADAQNYMSWVVGEFDRYLHGTILESGIGHGSYCSLLRARGRYLGIDLDADSVADAQARFPGLTFAQCDILDATALTRLVPEGIDAVVSINVLEHIEDDHQALANLIRVIRPGGHLLLSVPAFMALYNELDRLAGRRYTAARLREILRHEPVETLKLHYMNPIGGLGWWINSFIRPASLNSAGINAQIRLFDRYVVPISRTLDPLFRSFFSQSVICVARRL